jgi:hypothetical protein
MTPAETIQAAIEKLTRLRSEASPGPWAAWKKPVSTLYRTDLVKYGLEDARGVDLFGSESPHNVELIEALHATVSAQIALLRVSHLQTRIHGRKPTLEALNLAKAILGEQVDA